MPSPAVPLGVALWQDAGRASFLPEDPCPASPSTPDPARGRDFQDALFAMSWEVPAHRRILELEGLKQWMPPREEGYASLRAALDWQEMW